MVQRLHQQLLVRPEDIAPSHEMLEVIGTFNPGVTRHHDDTILLVRIAECPRERRAGYTALPRWEDGKVVTDWVANDDIERLDARVVRRKTDGLLRLTFTSHLLVIRSRNGRNIDTRDGPRLFPQAAWEESGIEDPRIVPLEGRYWIT